MIDSCADRNSLDVAKAREIGLEGMKVPFSVSGCGGTVTSYGEGLIAKLTVRSCTNPPYSRRIQVQCFPQPAGQIRPPDWSETQQSFEHLKRIPMGEFVDQPVTLIIGNDDPSLQISLEDIEGDESQPCARRYRLGWTMFGPAPVTKVKARCLTSIATPIDDNLLIDVTDEAFDFRFVKEAFMRLWDIERYPNDNKDFEPKLTPEELLADEIFERSECRVGQHMQYGLLWRKGEPQLENNFELASQRFFSQEKSHESRKAIRDEYQEQIREHVNLGYWTRLNLSFAQARAEKEANYLAHFPVIKPERTTTKMRVVHDAKAKYCGKSLNDCLLQGRKNLCDIVKVLSMFRTKPVAVTGDIKHMFLQILVRPEDQKYLRMIWRPAPDQQPQIFQASRHIFGLKSSPFISIECLKKTGRKYEDRYPRACEAIQESSIVDDILTSVDSSDEAWELINQLIEICDSIALKIRKFASNDLTVMSKLNEDQKAPNIELTDKSLYETALPVIKVLGLLYLAEKDLFAFRWHFVKRSRYTKSQMLSVIASLYDPLSFLAPFTVKARILFQKIWNYEVEWTQQIPKEIVPEWETWLKQTEELDDFTLERCLRPIECKVPSVSRQLHVFADASALAYSCALYYRTECSDGTVASRLVFCKAKLVPVRQKPSIPRAELEAAKVATRWAQIYSDWYSIPSRDVYLWSDSKTVLWWIFRERFPDVYVENRVFFIRQRSSPAQWRYVKSCFNPADLATRGVSAKKLTRSALWKYGPPFLNDSPESWEKFDPANEVPDEEAVAESRHMIVMLQRSIGCLEQPITHFLTSKFRSLGKVVRIVAYCRRFLKNLPLRKQFKSGEVGHLGPDLLTSLPVLSAYEIKSAKTIVVRQDQRLYLHALYLALTNPNVYQVDANLQKYCPRLDADNVIRMLGRLQSAKFMSAEVRAPVILGRDSQVARALVYDIHHGNHHIGNYQSLFNSLKQKYAVIGGLSMCKQIINECLHCKRKMARTSNQAMAPLPVSRLPNVHERLSAFSNIGMDLLGILHVKNADGQVQKRYLLVIVCMMTRALHVEITHDRSASSTIMALTRFQGRYGSPRLINTDNATNFAESAKEFSKVQEAFVDKELEWTFNPPTAAWFGGHYEVFIKMVKNAAFKALPTMDAIFTDEALATFVSEVVRVTNNRPLNYVSADEVDHVLTPAHFLIGSDVTSEIVCPPTIRRDLFGKFRHLQRVLDLMWQRLVTEYRPSLNVQTKWFDQREPFSVGDVVLIREQKSPRGKWPLAIVEEIVPSADPLQRVVKLRYNGKTIVRATNQLAPIVKIER